MIVIAGMVAIFKTDVDIFPDLNAPTVVVMTEAPAWLPEEVEQLVTFPVETSLNGAAGVRRVRSSSATGFSVVWVEFDWDTDVAAARQAVAEKLPALQSVLPPGAGIPTLYPQSSILGEILIVGLTSDTISPGTALYSRQKNPPAHSRHRRRVFGVGYGREVEEYRITLRPEKMRHLGITLTETVDALENFNANASGGILYDYGNEYLMKASLSTADAEEMGKAVIRGGDAPVILSDIADISIGPRLRR